MCHKRHLVLSDNRIRILLFAMTAAMLIFIFGMSSMNGEESTDVSVGLLDIINRLLYDLGFVCMQSDHILRKLAHFGEYFILGGLYLLDNMSLRGSCCICAPCFAGVITAAADELSQNLSYGRSPSCTDVFIDSSGILVGILFILCIVRIKTKLRRQ